MPKFNSITVNGLRIFNGDLVHETPECREKPWCAHLTEALSKNEDAEVIWQTVDSLKPDTFYSLTIPIMPSLDLWQDDVLCVRNNKRRLLEFFKSGKSNKISEQPICLLGPGEGLNVIRRTLIEEMWAKIDVNTIACHASSHSFPQEKRWQRDMQSGVDQFAQFWSVYSSGRCLSCRALAFSKIPDDLIPEKQGNGVFS